MSSLFLKFYENSSPYLIYFLHCQRNKDDIKTCAWSVKTCHWPYRPILAIGGTAGSILILEVWINPNDGIDLIHERTLTGHGGVHFFPSFFLPSPPQKPVLTSIALQPIRHITFSSHYPHLLVSASDDRTIRLWDPTDPNFSDEKVLGRMVQQRDIKKGDSNPARRFSHEEQLASFSVKGHERPVLYCVRPSIFYVFAFLICIFPSEQDIHPTKPLIVSSGADGYIKIWQIPVKLLETFTTWPLQPPHPPGRSKTLPFQLLGPPILSVRVHPGQWCDQALWASSHNLTIISKASRLINIIDTKDASKKLVKEVKVWLPLISTVQDGRKEKNRKMSSVIVPPEFTSDEVNHETLREVLDGGDSEHAQTVDKRNSSWSSLGVIHLGNGNRIGESFGFLRPSSLEHLDEPPGDTVLMVSTSKESLSFFTPLSSRQFETTTPSSEYTLPLKLSSVPPPNPPPKYLSKKARHHNLTSLEFPPTRDRSANEFDPRLSPAFVSNLKGKAGKGVFNCVAISPEEGKWVIGVGLDGCWVVWRRRQKKPVETGWANKL